MNECILVVDDDREIVGAIAIVLEREGYTVRRAYDGLVAVEQALDPAELQYHTENLTNILKLGVDGWWYDRNWGYTLHSPYEDSITFTTFGEVLYNDILASYTSTKRLFLLSNADWVRHGYVENAPSVIGHRYGIQWTGDITSEAMQLRREVEAQLQDGKKVYHLVITFDTAAFNKMTKEAQD